jgi:hypothetical protein
MSVKLALLKSGETLIADIQEMVLEERVVGYIFNKPQVVLVRDFKDIVNDDGENTSHTFDINLYPWIPFTSDEVIPTPIDWIVTLVEPKKKLKEMYESKVLKDGENNDKSNSDGEQSDSDNTD